MMTLSNLTAVTLIINVAVLIVYDIYVKVRQPDGEATISWVTLQAAKHAPILAVALGTLVGHLFWQNCNVP